MSGKDYQKLYGFALTEEECAIADLFFQHVTAAPGVQYVHLHPDIPADKLENAKSSFAPIYYGEAVLCLLDGTVFGSAKNGLLVTVRGLYWKNTAEPEVCRRSFDQVGNVLADTSFMGRGLTVGDGKKILLGGIDATVIQGLARFLNQVGNVSVKCWYLGIGGTQQGPFDIQTIRKKISSGEVDPQQCLAWKKGMTAWLPYMQVPELAGEQQQPPPLPGEAPPPMPSAAAPPMAAPASAPPARPVGSRDQEEFLHRQKHRMEDLRKRAEEAGDKQALEKLEKIVQERLAEKAEAYWEESATNPVMADQCADTLSLLSSRLDEIEAPLAQAEENKALLAGLEDLYRKEDRKPN